MKTTRNSGRSNMLSLHLFCIAIYLINLIAPGNGLRFARMRASKQPGSFRSMSIHPQSDLRMENPTQLVAEGMKAFKMGDIDGSIRFFDRADAAVPDGSLRPFLWQRGISYYYQDQFHAGSEQFRLDVRVNPLDVEEIVWDIACLSRLTPEVLPPPGMMSLPKGKTDRRKIMSTVYSLFRGEANEQDLALAGHNGSSADEFYAAFYLGLYCESRGEIGKAANYMKGAAATRYAKDIGFQDYMTSVARVHCNIRGWV